MPDWESKKESRALSTECVRERERGRQSKAELCREK